MKLVSFGKKGKERAGVIYKDKIIDINKAAPDIPQTVIEILQGKYLEKIKSLLKNNDRFSDNCYTDSSVRLGPPITSPGQIICLGSNYTGHIKEGKGNMPSSPLLFAKAVSSINGPYDDIVHPGLDKTQKLDYEVELAIVIARIAKKIKKDKAFDYIAGYTILNDISARDIQFNEKQWFRGKSLDTFAPLGPYLVTSDEITHPDNLKLESYVNSEIRQKSSTEEMIFTIAQIIEFITSSITLNPGDVIATGTPAGVGVFMDPPRFLKPGDTVEIKIEGLGGQKNKIV
jgi:2-keto-4-pentenoate hydratase/2-oxohepta-3-ene-1,7-dioic acid hydratase in catechol pathway